MPDKVWDIRPKKEQEVTGKKQDHKSVSESQSTGNQPHDEAQAGLAMDPLWSAMFHSTGEAILLFDAECRVGGANAAAARLLGKSPARVGGQSSTDLFKGTDLEPAAALLGRVKKARAPEHMELHIEKNDTWLLLKADPIIGASGKFSGVVHRLQDITARKKMESEIRDSEHRYRLLFEQAADPVMIVDADSGELVEFNDMSYQLMGYTREEFASRNMRAIEVPPSPEEAERVRQRLLVDGVSAHDTRYRACDGSLRDVRVSSRAIAFKDKRFIQIIWRDVTEQKRAEESMQALSLVDDLTGLYNRRGFQTLAEQQFRIASRMRKKMFLLFVDVDGMKRVNDTMGHREGNQLLVEAASALRQAFRNSDISARIGGDEFVVLVLEAERLYPAMLRGRLDSKIAAINSGGRKPALSMSVGVVAFNPDEPVTLEDLLHQADLAMYDEKRVKREVAARSDMDGKVKTQTGRK